MMGTGIKERIETQSPPETTTFLSPIYLTFIRKIRSLNRR